ncbi:MAG: hypothetical protein ABEJ94_01520 [Halorientalis sp.]
MDRPNLRGRVPDTITARLPGGASDSRLVTTLLTLAGLGLAGLGVALRYALDRRSADDPGVETGSDEVALDRDESGTVEIVGDADATGDGTESEPTADARESDTDGDGSSADAVTAAEPDVAVETFEADRSGDRDRAATDDVTDRDGPPRIAPLVGMLTLVGIRLFVERVRERTA